MAMLNVITDPFAFADPTARITNPFAFTPTGPMATNTQGNNQQGSSSNFDIPQNLYPSSWNIGYNQSSGGSQSSSRSGINWNTPIGQATLPLLIQAAQQIPQLAEQLPGTLQGMYSNLMRQALGPEAFQGALNSLASRGLIDSSVASNALSSAAQGIANQIGNQGYNSFLAGLQAQMQVGGLLSQLAKLAEQSTSSSSSSTASSGGSFGYQSDPLAPYRLMASLLMY